MDDSQARKNRVMKSIEKYLTKQEPKQMRHNDKPEARIVKDIYTRCNEMGWSVDWFEAKAVYDPRLGEYRAGQMIVGFPDLSGCDLNGIALYIEVKNIGSRYSRASQDKFLRDKIEITKGQAFCCVVTSFEMLMDLYRAWKLAEDKKLFLVQNLPKVKKDLYPDDLSDLD